MSRDRISAVGKQGIAGPAAYLGCAWLLLPIVAQAQWRPGQPEVLDPPPQPEYMAPYYEGEFRHRYEQAGSPTMVLFWNQAFDDQIEMVNEDLDISVNRGSRQYGSLTQATAGEAGTATHTEGDDASEATSTRIRTRRVSDPSRRTTNLSERDMAELRVAFVGTLRGGGVTFVDRSSAVRITAARGEAGDNRKTVETAAVLDHAKMLVEIVMVSDTSAPLGWGFRVSVRDLGKVTEVLSLYTRAVPMLPPASGRYVATDRGFEWFESQTEMTIADVGVELANEVMRELGPLLGSSGAR